MLQKQHEQVLLIAILKTAFLENEGNPLQLFPLNSQFSLVNWERGNQAHVFNVSGQLYGKGLRFLMKAFLQTHLNVVSPWKIMN